MLMGHLRPRQIARSTRGDVAARSKPHRPYPSLLSPRRPYQGAPDVFAVRQHTRACSTLACSKQQDRRGKAARRSACFFATPPVILVRAPPFAPRCWTSMLVGHLRPRQIVSSPRGDVAARSKPHRPCPSLLLSRRPYQGAPDVFAVRQHTRACYTLACNKQQDRRGKAARRSGCFFATPPVLLVRAPPFAPRCCTSMLMGHLRPRQIVTSARGDVAARSKPHRPCPSLLLSRRPYQGAPDVFAVHGLARAQVNWRSDGE